jgi:holliday junction DNA helicase RuvA
MFSFIRGILAQKKPDSVVVENNGIGYLLSVPLSTYNNLKDSGTEVKLYTYLAVREDSLTLYGFSDAEGRELFELLLSVSGVGPKAALNVLSALSPAEFYFAVMREDIKALTRVSGIGPKSAKRLLMELREKVEVLNLLPQTGQRILPGDAHRDAIDALLALGYSAAEAQSALQEARAKSEGEISGKELLRLALAKLGSR